MLRKLTATMLMTAAVCAVPAAASAAALTGDVNGDGLDDVVVTELPGGVDNQLVTVYFGTRDRSSPPPQTAPGDRGFTIIADGGDGLLGETAQIIGDANGDRLADVLVGGGDAETAIVYGKRDTATVDAQSLRRGEGVALAEVDGEHVSGAGDVNGDGLADLVFEPSISRALAEVRFGARTRPFRRGFTIFRGGRLAQDSLAPSFTTAGDLNGDGLGDIAISATDPGGEQDGFDVAEIVAVVWGRRATERVTVTMNNTPSSGRVTTAAGRPAGRVFVTRRGACLCQTFALVAGGDLSGDRLDDLVVQWQDAANGDHRTDVLLGSRSAAPAVIPGPAAASVRKTGWVTAPVALGDVTGDGRTDLLLDDDRGSLRVLSGAKLRAGRTVALSRRGTARVRRADIAASAGDFDGDGREDVLLARSFYSGPVFARWFVLHGARPLPAVDLKRPGSALTVLPPR